MITSEQIAARVGSYPRHDMPSIYGRQATGSFRHGDNDPYSYGIASKAAGTMVGMGGVSVMGGIVGGSMAFGAGISGIKGAWSGLTSSANYADAKSLWGAGKYASAIGSVGARGIGGSLLAGAAAFAPQYLGYKAVSAAGSAIYRGARFQQDSNRIMSRHMRFQNNSSSRTGFGASTEQMRGVSQMVTKMADKDSLRSRDELMRVMDKLGQSDFFQSTTSVDKFSGKFKKLVKTLTHMARSFGTSLEEAVPLMAAMKHSGIYSNKAQMQTARQIRMSGLSPQMAMSAMQGGAAIGRASGGHGGAAAEGTLTMMRQLRSMTQMKGIGKRTSNLMTEITGGQTGEQAMASTSQRMSALTLKFLKGPLGRMALAGLANKDMTGMDGGSMELLLNKRMSLSELRKRGFKNTASMGNKAKFVNREGDLRTAFLKQGGMTGMASLVHSAFRSKILKGSSNADIQELIMSRFTGGNRREAQLLQTAMQKLPQMRRDMTRAGIRQGDLHYRAYMGRERFSGDAIKRRAGSFMRRTFSRPLERLGQNIYSGLNDSFRGMIDDMTGTTSAHVTGQAASSFHKAAGGSASAMSDLKRRIGVGDGRPSAGLDLQRRRGTVDSLRDFGIDSSLSGSLPMSIIGVAIQGLVGKRRNDLGDNLHQMIGTNTLKGYGAQQRSMGKQGDLAIIHRTDARGRLMQSNGDDNRISQALVISKSQLHRVISLEKRRASGQRAAEIVRKFTDPKDKSAANKAAAMIRTNIINNSDVMNKLRNASPSERRQIMRKEFRKIAKPGTSVGKWVNRIAGDNEYKGVGAGAAQNQAMDDAINVAETALQKVGIDSQSRYVSGDMGDSYNTVKAAQAAQKDALDALGWAGRGKSVGDAAQYLTGGGIDERKFLQNSDLFKSENLISNTVMRHAAGGMKLTKAQENAKDRIIGSKGGEMNIGGHTLQENQVDMLRNILQRAPESGALGGLFGKSFTKEKYKKWRDSIHAQNQIGIATQVNRFGAGAVRALKGMKNPLASKLTDFAESLTTVRSKADIIGLAGGDKFGVIAEDFSSLGKKKQGEMLSQLRKRGSFGSAISGALQAYITKDGTNEEKRKAAGSTLLSTAVGKGKVTVGARKSLDNALTVWNDYVRANQRFVDAVSVALKDKDLAGISASLKSKRKVTT